MKYFIILACVIASCTIAGYSKETRAEVKKPTVIQSEVMPGSYALLSV